MNFENILDGNKVAKVIKSRIKKITTEIPKTPVLQTILVGEDPASKIYVNYKKKVCEEVGIKGECNYPGVCFL